MKKFLQFASILMLSSFILFSCDDKDDSEPEMSELDRSINEFIWKGMYNYYLWQADVPALNPNQFSNQASLDKYLKQHPDHEAFFNQLLYKEGTVDRFSWIVDDYEALEAMFEGVSKSMGFEFRLALYDTDKVLGYVIYVLPNSPASKAGIKRGDVFTHINNTMMTKSNYSTLLDNESYSISIAYISNNTIYQTGVSKSLTAQVIQENPIFLDSIYTNGSKKIGYLVYNSFISNYDNKLNAVMKDFKSQGVTDLILDLRYNGGGAVTSAIYLSSMIYSTDKTKIFSTSTYNSGFSEYLRSENDPSYFTEYFTDKIVANPDEAVFEEPITTLGLSKLYVITTYGSASASELVINCLKPYISVVHVGETTYGKYVGSFTIKDMIGENTVNPNHKWAMQPICLKMANSSGVTDYYQGLTPTHPIDETLETMRPLGDLSEPLLSKAYQLIVGLKSAESIKPSFANSFGDSKDLKPHTKEMYIKTPPLMK